MKSLIQVIKCLLIFWLYKPTTEILLACGIYKTYPRKVCSMGYLAIFRDSEETQSECTHKSLNASAIWILHEPYSYTVHPFISFHRARNLQSLTILLQPPDLKPYGYTMLQMEREIHLMQPLLAVLLHWSFQLGTIFISCIKCTTYIHSSFSTFRMHPGSKNAA